MPKRTTCPAVFSLRRKPGTNRRRQGSSTRSCRRLNELVSPDIGLPYSICCTLPTRSEASRKHATMTSTPAQVGMRESLHPPALFLLDELKRGMVPLWEGFRESSAPWGACCVEDCNDKKRKAILVKGGDYEEISDLCGTFGAGCRSGHLSGTGDSGCGCILQRLG